NETEQKLAEIWQELLGIEQAGIHDNFFELGGDSIRVIRVVSKIADVFGKRVSVFDVYRGNTLSQLAVLIDDNTAENEHKLQVYQEVRDEFERLKELALPAFTDADQIEDIYPMSDIERGMVYASLLNPEEALYHDQFVIKIPKNFNQEIIKKAFDILVKKHSILRTAFSLDVASEDLQIVYKTIAAEIDYFDITAVRSEDIKNIMEAYLAKERNRPFVMQKAPLWRASVFGWDKYNMLVFQFHHAILDGWSVASFNTELYQLCTSLSTEKDFVSTTLLKCNYKDYVIENLVAKRDESNTEFWKKELSGYKRLNIFSIEDQYRTFVKEYDIQFLEKLKEKTKQDNISLKGLFLGAYLFALGILTYEDELTVGLVTNNRPILEDGDKLLGCFLNTSPARFEKGSTVSTWRSYFEQIEHKLFQLKERDRTSLLEITKIVNEPSVDGNPFFDAIFNFVNFHVYEKLDEEVLKESMSETDNEALAIDGYELTNTYLDCTTNLTADHLVVNYSLRKKLLSGKSLEEIHAYFDEALMAYLEHYESLMKNNIVTTPEYLKLNLFSNLANEYLLPAEKTVVDLFEEQVNRTPDHIALVSGDNRLTYRELSERSSQLGHYLKNKGVDRESLVPICIDRSLEMIIGILGILKAGGAYVPVDTSYPEERIAYVLADCNCQFVLTTTSYAYLCNDQEKEIEVFCLDDLSAVLQQQPVVQMTYDIKSSDLAYVIYTSGSTGRPKGVMIEHHSVVNLIHWHIAAYELTAESQSTSMASVGFDAFGWEIWPYLSAGSTVHLLNDDIRISPEDLMKYFVSASITHSFMATGLVTEMINTLNKRETSLKFLLTGGDRLPAVNTTDLSCILVNNYGPTENTIVTTSYQLSDQEGAILPSIGKPVLNSVVYVLDANLGFSPIGVPGELCIGGPQLARGYLNLPALTAEKFITDPFDAEKRLYRSGDLVRWLPDGNLEYLGRIDDQVKIRGYRIELGEIENILRQHPQIAECVVLAKADHTGNKRLVGYVLSQEIFDKEDIQSWLKGHLPDYMIPALWVELKEIPLTSNGKIDRKALPDVEEEKMTSVAFTAARNKTEQLLELIWKELLGVERVGVYDNFFDLGGHSLLAMRLAAAIRKELLIELAVKELFTYPTIATLAAYLEGKDVDALLPAFTVQSRPDRIPLSFSQERLWFIDQLEGSVPYHITEVLEL
ncbi:non-ribosomal peptide synthetase, partial [Pedobacter cryoconitis]